MKPVSQMSETEHDAFKRQMWCGATPRMPATVLPNGSRVDYDRQLGAAVETCPDGSRYIVRLGETGLTRAVELAATETRTDRDSGRYLKSHWSMISQLVCAAELAAVSLVVVTKTLSNLSEIVLGTAVATLLFGYLVDSRVRKSPKRRG